ncbi:MAG: hypothetical protein OXG81_08610 [Acidobacteria bacterium]|nr:hypothetical protein [Acidobacteriota bacterium]
MEVRNRGRAPRNNTHRTLPRIEGIKQAWIFRTAALHSQELPNRARGRGRLAAFQPNIRSVRPWQERSELSSKRGRCTTAVVGLVHHDRADADRTAVTGPGAGQIVVRPTGVRVVEAIVNRIPGGGCHREHA